MGKDLLCCILLLFMPALLYAQHNPVIYLNFDKTTFIQIQGTPVEKIEIGGEDSVIIYKQFQTTQGTFIQLSSQYDTGFIATNLLLVCKDTVMQYDLVFKQTLPQTMYTVIYRGLPGMGKTLPASNPAPMDSLVINGDMRVPTAIMLRMQQLSRNVNVAVASNRLVFLLDNIGVDSQYIYFKVRLRNSSQVDYNVDYLKFIVESQRKRKSFTDRTIIPSQSLYPSYVEAPTNAKVIKAKDQQELIFALNKFALSEEELLSIVMKERTDNSKGRVVELKVRPAAFNNIIRL